MSSSDSPELPPALDGTRFTIGDQNTGALHVYRGGPSEGVPLLLVHSVNAAASAAEMRPLYEHYASGRPTYAFDLPGFGLSERGPRLYTPRLMTDALLLVLAEIRERHQSTPVDVAALSLSCEFAARAGVEAPESVRSLALISPTGFDRRGRRDGPPESTWGKAWFRSLLEGVVGDGLFALLTRPGVVRYFLRRAWGQQNIDDALWAYCVKSAHQPGAKHAPVAFLSGFLFSGDISRIYDALNLPVWMSHGVRGDFVDYTLANAYDDDPKWSRTELPTGALPHFEVPERFIEAYDAFLAGLAH